MQYKKYFEEKRLFFLLGIFIILLLLVFFTILKNKSQENSILSHLDIPQYTRVSFFPKEIDGIPVFTDLIDKSDARPMKKRVIQYVVIHETDNYLRGVGARNHATYLKYNNKTPTSWHYTVDDHEIAHHIPDNEIAHHAGDDDGNEHGIGVELCVNQDGNFSKTFDNAAKLVAYLLRGYNLDMDAIKTHHDFTGKDCPNRILKNHQLDEFKKRVESYL